MRILLISALVTIASSFTAPLRVVNPTTISSTTSSSTTTLYAAANGSGDKKKVIVLGGDGFCGWPTSLFLSDQGHDVVIVDNLSRRNIDNELGCDSLTPIQSPEVRAKSWVCVLEVIYLLFTAVMEKLVMDQRLLAFHSIFYQWPAVHRLCQCLRTFPLTCS